MRVARACGGGCVISRRVVRDIASFVLDLLDVGYETASNLLSNGAIQRLSSDSWDTLSDSPERIRAAVEGDPALRPAIVKVAAPCDSDQRRQ